MGTSLESLLTNPDQIGGRLVDGLSGVYIDRILAPRFGGLVFDITFDPPPELVIAGYQNEQARISVRTEGEPLTFPRGPHREWKHRYPAASTSTPAYCCGQLCLWFPRDPPPLKWLWQDGFEDYVSRVHRHLFLEEHWRRTGVWPTEDVPHGLPELYGVFDPLGHGSYPIRSRALRNAVSTLADARSNRRKAS
jgi:hypothetical protein